MLPSQLNFVASNFTPSRLHSGPNGSVPPVSPISVPSLGATLKM